MFGQYFLIAMLILPTLSEQKIPLQQLYEIVKLYPEVSFCERTIVSGYWIDYEAGNVRHITYKGKVKSNETDRELCNCMHDHMTQRDWLYGATKICESQCGFVTYHVSGKPDPTYDPNATPDKDFDRPLEKLRVLFSNTPETDPIGLLCTANCTEESDVITCTLECPLINETRSSDDICDELESYYNQKGWLDGASTVCGETDGVLEVEFTGTA